jgi:hypothetical protein
MIDSSSSPDQSRLHLLDRPAWEGRGRYSVFLNSALREVPYVMGIRTMAMAFYVLQANLSA